MKEKSTERPWYGWEAVSVELRPAGDLAILAWMHTG